MPSSKECWLKHCRLGPLLLFLDDHLLKKMNRALLSQSSWFFIWTIYYIKLNTTPTLDPCLHYSVYFFTLDTFLGYIVRSLSLIGMSFSLSHLHLYLVRCREVRSRLIFHSLVPPLQLTRINESPPVNASMSVTATIYN